MVDMSTPVHPVAPPLNSENFPQDSGIAVGHRLCLYSGNYRGAQESADILASLWSSSIYFVSRGSYF